MLYISKPDGSLKTGRFIFIIGYSFILRFRLITRLSGLNGARVTSMAMFCVFSV